MSKKHTLKSVAAGAAFAAGLAVPVAQAADNPFAMQSLERGYMVAGHHMGEGKCGGKMGDGHCGMSMADTNKDGKVSKEEAGKQHEAMFDKMDANKDGVVDKSEMGKMGEGKCGEGKCGAAKKPMEGKCGGAKMPADGKCGANK